MQLQAISYTPCYSPKKPAKSGDYGHNLPLKNNPKAILNYLNYCGNINRALISFGEYKGDSQPANRLFWILTGRNKIYKDDFTNEHLFNRGNTGFKKWVDIQPHKALLRTPEQAIQSILTLTNNTKIPEYIPTPNYGDKWGRHANYIEINPRLIAKHNGNKISEGLLNATKLLPLLPPSGNRYANCIVLSQLFPCFYNDSEGAEGFGSLYTVNLHSGISKNLTSRGLSRNGQHISDDEQVKAFNDLAHLMGFKTGIRMPLSEGQMTVKGRPFNWYSEKEAYIDACCHAVDLGFDSIFFDSAKHIGGWDMANYCGSGGLPDYSTMQEITSKIREKTGRNDLSFVGEKCNNDDRYRNMGLSAGTDWGNPDNKEEITRNSRDYQNEDYAPGPDVSNDNDDGRMHNIRRSARLENSLFGLYKNDMNNKLPVFMQMADIFTLRNTLNTHKEMMESISYSAYGDAESHYHNIFDTYPGADAHRRYVYEKFADAMYL